MNRREIIQKQGWSKETLAHLMEFFIERRELGEEFDAYLRNTAQQENAEAGVCDFCNGHGAIEICAGIGPRLACPKCGETDDRDL